MGRRFVCLIAASVLFPLSSTAELFCHEHATLMLSPLGPVFGAHMYRARCSYGPFSVLLSTSTICGAHSDCFRCSFKLLSVLIWTFFGTYSSRMFSMLNLECFRCSPGPFPTLTWTASVAHLDCYRCSSGPLSVLLCPVSSCFVLFVPLRQRRTRSCASALSAGALSGDLFASTRACVASCCYEWCRKHVASTKSYSATGQAGCASTVE